MTPGIQSMIIGRRNDDGKVRKMMIALTDMDIRNAEMPEGEVGIYG